MYYIMLTGATVMQKLHVSYWIWTHVPGLTSSQNSVWDLNPRARTQTSQNHCLFFEITHLVSEHNKAQVLYVSGFPCGSAGKESACNVRDLSLIPGLGRSCGEGKGCSLQYSDLENSVDCIDHGVAKSWPWLSDFHFHFLYVWLKNEFSEKQSDR